MFLCNLPVEVCGWYNVHAGLVCSQTNEGGNSRQQHLRVCVKWVFHGWQSFLFRSLASAARFQMWLNVCVHSALI